MTFLVMGATGNVGGEVVAQLAKRGLPVRAVSRRERTWAAGAEGFVGDPNQEGGLDDALDGVTGVFMMSGYAAEAGLLRGLDRAHVVVLSSSSAVLEDTGNAMAAMHRDSERAVESSSLPWTFLRPCSMQSNLLRWRDQLSSGDVVRTPFADVPVAMVHPADVAAIAVLALTTPGHAASAYRLSGPDALLPARQVELLGAALGRGLTAASVEDEAVRDQMGPEYGDATIEIFRGHPDLESDVQSTIPDLLGRPALSLESWIERHRQEFTDES